VIDLHSTPVIVAVVVGIVALSAITGYLVAVARLTGDDAHGVSSGGETATAGGGALDVAGARYGSAVEHFSQALKACEGTRQRLGRLAETARATATAFRECYAVRFKPSGRRVDAGARAPWELRRERSAVGDQRVAAVRSQPRDDARDPG
jgi:hypothetical protein